MDSRAGGKGAICMSPSPPVTVIFCLSREELGKRGKKGGEITHARYPDGRMFTAPARAAFNQRFTDADTRREYFAELGRRSAAARRARKGGEA